MSRRGPVSYREEYPVLQVVLRHELDLYIDMYFIVSCISNHILSTCLDYSVNIPSNA